MNKPLLDDPEKIRAIDKSGMIDFYINAAKHYRNATDIAQKIQVNYPKPDNIIVVGMGGSAIGGGFLKNRGKNKIKNPPSSKPG